MTIWREGNRGSRGKEMQVSSLEAQDQAIAKVGIRMLPLKSAEILVFPDGTNDLDVFFFD
jgi:hypothetical protein